MKSHFYYFLHYAIIFLTNILIANYYLAEIFGEYQFYITLFTLLATFSQFGTVQSYVVLAPKIKNSIKLIYASIIIRIVGYLLVSLLMLVIFIIYDFPTIAYLFLLWFIPYTINLTSIMDYFEETHIEVKYNLFYDGFIFIVLTLTIIYFEESILFIVFSRFITKLLSEYFKFMYIVNNFGEVKFSKKYVKWMFVKSKIHILNRIVAIVYTRSEILLLGVIGTKKELGYFAVAYMIYNSILIGEGLLSRKLFPKLTKNFNDRNKIKEVLNLSILYKGLYYISMIILTYFVFNDILFTYIYNSEEYNQSSIILDLMLIGLITYIFGNNVNYLLMLKDNSIYMKRYFLGILLNLVLGYSFYQFYQIEGYTIALQIVKIILIVLTLIISYSHLKNQRLIP